MNAKQIAATIDVLMNEVSVEKAAAAHGVPVDMLRSSVTFFREVAEKLPLEVPEAGILVLGGTRFAI